MTLFESGLIHGVLIATLDSYGERNGRIVLQYPILEMLQNVYADHCFGASKAKRFRVTLVENKEHSIWFPQAMLLFHLCTQTNASMSREFAFVRHF